MVEATRTRRTLSTPSWLRGWKPFLIGALVAILAALLLYGLGRAGWTRETNVLLERQSELQARTERLESENALLRSRSSLFTALRELDRRNFGSANEAVVQARRELERVDANRIGAPTQALQEAQAALGQLRLSVAQDLEPQRQRLLEASERLEALDPR
jgi:hypothetical protein